MVYLMAPTPSPQPLETKPRLEPTMSLTAFVRKQPAQYAPVQLIPFYSTMQHEDPPQSNRPSNPPDPFETDLIQVDQSGQWLAMLTTMRKATSNSNTSQGLCSYQQYQESTAKNPKTWNPRPSVLPAFLRKHKRHQIWRPTAAATDPNPNDIPRITLVKNYCTGRLEQVER
jgi:hypothetical protein